MREKCFECGGDLFPFEDFEFEDDPEDLILSDDDSQRVLEEIRAHRKANNVQSDLFEGIGEYVSSNYHQDRGPIVEKVSDTFQCPSDLTGCPVASKAKVFIPVDLFNKWVYLARRLDTEWIAYLTGEETGDNEYTIKDMYFPKQKANGVHCEAEDGEIREGTIAAVHSHVGMRAFFSAEDERHFNHTVELVVNRAGDIVANGRTRLECGRWHRGTASVIFTGCEEAIDMEKELRENIAPDKAVFKVVK